MVKENSVVFKKAVDYAKNFSFKRLINGDNISDNQKRAFWGSVINFAAVVAIWKLDHSIREVAVIGGLGILENIYQGLVFSHRLERTGNSLSEYHLHR